MIIPIHQTSLAAGLPLPRLAHVGEDVGFDLPTAIDFTVEPGNSVKVPTGLVFDLPTATFRVGGFFGIGGIPVRIALVIEQRTGNGGRGLFPAATIVDPGYRPDASDENGLTLWLRNVGNDLLNFKRGDKVMQGLFILMAVPRLRLTPLDKIRWTTKRMGMRFGETG